MQLFLVLQDFQRDLLFPRGAVVHAADDDPESATAQFFNNLVPVVNLVTHFNSEVITILAVEAIIELTTPTSGFRISRTVH